ncbi:MAG: hypothetical protein A2138_11170 [Deltaproteobacteria bacterium RBG_16_71_12]|nr:MAG: hypothetical protein A2138_11170 [Deltaproteobacteria bacterium RBG_16_71_12]
MQSIRNMAARDWGLPERLRVERAADELRAHGPAGALAIGDMLRAHGQMVRGTEQSADARAVDLAGHLRLHGLLERASLGLRRR